MKKVSDQSGACDSGSVLDEIVHAGAQRMLTQALEAEIEAFVDRHRHVVDEEGRRQVVRNGHSPTPQVLTGAGQLEV